MSRLLLLFRDHWKLMRTPHKRRMKSITFAMRTKFPGDSISYYRKYVVSGGLCSGKPSVMHSMTVYLNFEVYGCSLREMGMVDSTLKSVIAALPDKYSRGRHTRRNPVIADPEKQN
ncbi:hypothetical protein K466DRAFT_602177 [Polyporus arcularius HHB13444]|uniref:Uncharacterized protein n=1 Tax=Polyporus arcularius HHB13444 TaxID=1314778 RepID=A0A5C3P3K1_9APHY|nr:hypothetical protein K466DRAFT_602177 [Polyporus arcularius HHB13444]